MYKRQAESNSAGITTISTEIEHDLNAITNLTVTVPGSAYGANTILYNQALTGAGTSGGGATVKVRTGTGGTITAVEIVDGGASYGIGQTLAVGGGTDGVVQVTGINAAVDNVIQVVGVGSVDDRTNGAFNGLYKVTSVPSTKSVTYTHVAQGQTAGSTAGIYTGPVLSLIHI